MTLFGIREKFSAKGLSGKCSGFGLNPKLKTIGVNAVDVAGVATPQYLTCRGRLVLTTLPNILTSVVFFSFSGTSEYRKSLSFSPAIRPVY